MSNFLNGGYTQLNDLIQVNADDIQTENINTKTLYKNNILFNPTGTDTSDLARLSTNQNISGVKSFSGTQVFSSIQLNSDLIVNSGGTTISNSQLKLIPNISTNTTDISALKLLLSVGQYSTGYQPYSKSKLFTPILPLRTVLRPIPVSSFSSFWNSFPAPFISATSTHS